MTEETQDAIMSNSMQDGFRPMHLAAVQSAREFWADMPEVAKLQLRLWNPFLARILL